MSEQTEDQFAEQFGQDTPTADPAKVIHVTNVNPYAKTLDPNQVQIPFWKLVALIFLAAMDVVLLFAIVVANR